MFGKKTQEDNARVAAGLVSQKQREAADRAARELAEYQTADHQDRLKWQSFVPAVRVEDYENGKFLLYGDFEAPIQFIESIRVAETGSPPQTSFKLDFLNWPDISDPWGRMFHSETAFAATMARIEIAMHSGAKHIIRVSRHGVDQVYDRLRYAWKHRTVEGYGE